MIESVWVENQNGDRLDINLRNSGDELGFLVINLDGVGSPKATINSSGGPSYDGVRVNSIRAEARQISFNVAVTARGDAEEVTRAMIYEYFPSKERVKFGVKTDVREVYVDAIVEQNEMVPFAKVENATISLFCDHPYFKDVSEREYFIDSESGLPRFEFPFSNESLTEPLLIFGLMTILPTSVIPYAGGKPTGCEIDILFKGAASGIEITNSHGGQRMTLDTSDAETYFGQAPVAEDQIKINTRKGEKSIYYVHNNEYYNMLNGVGIDDDWIELRPGTNTIVVTATSGESNLETDIRFRPEREGV